MTIRFSLTKKLLFFVFLAPISWACTNDQARDLDLLPPARGGKGEILVVLDSTKWNSPLGEAIKNVLHEKVDALPQPEPSFATSFVTPSLFKGLLKNHRNVVMLTTFDSDTRESKYSQSSFTKESIARIKSDKSLYTFINEDEYAKGQRVMHLFAQTEAELIQVLKDKEQDIQNYFNKREETAIESRLFSTRSQTLENMLAQNHGLNIMLPKGFQIANDTTNFAWIRHPEVKFDKSIFVAYKPYSDEAAFQTDSIVAWRNAICKEYLYGNPEKPNSFLITESLVPVESMETSISGKYAKEVRGLWKTNTVTMGGPFISYTFVDEKQNRIYYVEGFIYAPSISKRELLREMKVVLNSIRL